jgi:hypothetical protein
VECDQRPSGGHQPDVRGDAHAARSQRTAQRRRATRRRRRTDSRRPAAARRAGVARSSRVTPRRPSTQYLCRGCGYGISVKGELPVCPMCQRRIWKVVGDPGDPRAFAPVVRDSSLTLTVFAGCPLAARGRVGRGRTRRRLLSSPSLCVHTMAVHRWRAGGVRRRESSTPPAEPLSAYEEVEPGDLNDRD